MKLYFCRVRGEESTYMSRLTISGETFIRTTDINDVNFTTDLEGIKEVARKFPELEVCCLEGEVTVISIAKNTVTKRMKLGDMNYINY